MAAIMATVQMYLACNYALIKFNEVDSVVGIYKI